MAAPSLTSIPVLPPVASSDYFNAQPEWKKSLAAHADELQAMGGGAAAMLGTAVGSPGLQQWGQEVYNRNMEESQAGWQAPAVPRIEDVKFSEPGAMGRLWDFGVYNAVKGVASAAEALAGGFAGGALKVGIGTAANVAAKEVLKKEVGETLGKALVTKEAQDVAKEHLATQWGRGMLAGTLGTNAAMESTQAFGGMVQEGIKPEDALVPALGYGAASSAVEWGPEAALAHSTGLLKLFKDSVRKEIAGSPDLAKKAVELAQKSMSAKALGVAGKVAKGAAAGGAMEGLEEGTQQLLQIAAERIAKKDPVFGQLTPEQWSGVLNSTAAGTAGGIVMGGAAGPFVAGREQGQQVPSAAGETQVPPAGTGQPQAPTSPGTQTPPAEAPIPPAPSAETPVSSTEVPPTGPSVVPTVTPSTEMPNVERERSIGERVLDAVIPPAEARGAQVRSAQSTEQPTTQPTTQPQVPPSAPEATPTTEATQEAAGAARAPTGAPIEPPNAQQGPASIGLAEHVIKAGKAETYQVESILGNLHDHGVSQEFGHKKKQMVQTIAEELDALSPEQRVEVAQIREDLYGKKISLPQAEERLTALRKLGGSPNAQQVQGPSTPDGGGSAQFGVRQEGGGATERGAGVQPGGQGQEQSEIAAPDRGRGTPQVDDGLASHAPIQPAAHVLYGKGTHEQGGDYIPGMEHQDMERSGDRAVLAAAQKVADSLVQEVVSTKSQHGGPPTEQLTSGTRRGIVWFKPIEVNGQRFMVVGRLQAIPEYGSGRGRTFTQQSLLVFREDQWNANAPALVRAAFAYAAPIKPVLSREYDIRAGMIRGTEAPAPQIDLDNGPNLAKSKKVKPWGELKQTLPFDLENDSGEMLALEGLAQSLENTPRSEWMNASAIIGKDHPTRGFNVNVLATEGAAQGDHAFYTSAAEAYKELRELRGRFAPPQEDGLASQGVRTEVRTAAQVRAELDKAFGKSFVDRAIRTGLLKIVEGPSADGRAGEYHGGTITLFAGSQRQGVPAGVAAVFLHEGSHAGMDTLLGGKLMEFAHEIEGLKTAAATRAQNEAITAMTDWQARKLKIAHKMYDLTGDAARLEGERVRAAIDAAMAKMTPEALEKFKKLSDQVRAEELVAYYVQFAKDVDGGGLFRRIVNAIKAWVYSGPLGKMGLKPTLTDDLVVALARRATERAMLVAEGLEQLGIGKGGEVAGELASHAGGPTWRSTTLEAIQGINQRRASGEQWLNMLTRREKDGRLVGKLPGVRVEEMEDMGLVDWLEAQKGVVDKDQVEQFVKDGGIRLEEVQYEDDDAYRERVEKQVQKAKDIEIARRVSLGISREEAEYQLLVEDFWAEEWAKYDNKSPKFTQYQVPGGQNYRELLATIPGGEFTSGHWPEKGVLVHLRFNERTDAEGKRVLFVEEVQSDLQQKYRKGKHNISAPMKQTSTWAMLGMKRAIKWAADNGFDRVAWTPGEVQAERYPEYNGGPKDQERKAGMQGFYDKMLPNEVGKWAKKFGGKVGQTTVVTNPLYTPEEAQQAGAAALEQYGEGQRAWFLDITPEMRAEADRGMALYSHLGATLHDWQDQFVDWYQGEHPEDLGAKQRFHQWFQDKLAALKGIEKAQKISPDESIYGAENRVRSKMMERIKALHRDTVDKMLVIAARNKWSDKVLDQVAYARAAEEVNQWGRRRTAMIWLGKFKEAMADKAQRKLLEADIEAVRKATQVPAQLNNGKTVQRVDKLARQLGMYSVLKEWASRETNDKHPLYETTTIPKKLMAEFLAFDQKPSGMTDADARKELAKWANNADMQHLFQIFDDMNRKVAADLLAHGNISQEMYQRWTTSYQHYAALRRMGYEKGQGAGAGHSTGKASMLREFSPKLAVNVFTNTIMGAERAIVLQENNDLMQAFAEMVEKKLVPGGYDGFSVTKLSKAPYVDRDGFLQEGPTKAVQFANGEAVFYRGGERYLIRAKHDNQAAMSVIQAMNNMDHPELGPVLKMFAGATRFMAQLNTSLSPEFFFTNQIRDFLESGINMSDSEADVLRGRIIKEIPKVWGALRKIYRGRTTGTGMSEKGGARDVWSHPMIDWVRRYEAAGVPSSWMAYYESAQSRAGDIQRRIKELGADSNPHKVLHAARSFIEDYNAVAENAIRLATFKTLVQNGVSEAKAAAIAKDLTVNFDRRGNGGVAINSLFMFANAGIQGSARLLRAIGTNRKVQKIAVGIVLTSLLVDLLNAWDDDDWDKVPESVKARNLVFRNPTGVGPAFVTLPAPWGYNVLWSIGRRLGELARGKQGQSVTGASVDTIKDMMHAFNPIEGGTMLQTITPTLLRPFAMIGENKNWTGEMPLRPEPFPGQEKPDSQLYWSTTSATSRWLTEHLNMLGGGDRVTSGGWVDVSPTSVDAWFGAVFGSLGKTVSNALDLGAAAWGGGDLEIGKVPVVRKFVAAPTARLDSAIYHDRAAQVLGVEQRLKQYEEGVNRDVAKAREMRQEERALLGMAGAVKDSERQLKSLRQRVALAEARGDVERVGLLRGQMRQVQERFNQAWARRMEGGGTP